MLASDVMRIRAEAQDDFGVRDLGLAWDVVSEAGQAEQHVNGDQGRNDFRPAKEGGGHFSLESRPLSHPG